MTTHALQAALAIADEPMPPARPSDWRACYPNDGIASPFVKVGVPRWAGRHANSTLVLYATPEILTDFPCIADSVASFLAAYFQVSVTPCSRISVSSVAAHNQRGDQLRTAALLEPLGARPNPTDKRLVLTSRDIYDEDSDNFVFGVADHCDSKAVVSLHRYGIPARIPLAGIPLTRLLKITSHELGHLYHLRHCTAALCNMNGTNSIQELDSHPLELCSQCLSTLLWFTGTDPLKRFSDLGHFYAQHNLPDEQAIISRRTSLLTEPATA